MAARKLGNYRLWWQNAAGEHDVVPLAVGRSLRPLDHPLLAAEPMTGASDRPLNSAPPAQRTCLINHLSSIKFRLGQTSARARIANDNWRV